MTDKNMQLSAIKHDFEKLASTSGESSKRKMINSFKGTLTNRALRMYLDPAVKFKLKANDGDGDTPEFQNFFALCRYLQENEGKDAERLFLESIRPELRDFVRGFLRRNLSIGVSLEDYNSCNSDKPIQQRPMKKSRPKLPAFEKVTVLPEEDTSFDVDAITYTVTVPVYEECQENEQSL